MGGGTKPVDIVVFFLLSACLGGVMAWQPGRPQDRCIGLCLGAAMLVCAVVWGLLVI